MNQQLIDLPPPLYRVRALDADVGEPYTVAVCGEDIGWAENISRTLARDDSALNVWIEVASWSPL